MVRPSSMALRTFISASSSTALPEVRAVMARPSRMGTPEVIRVPRVRVKRATAIFLSSIPMTGACNRILSVAYRPCGCFLTWRMPMTRAPAPRMKNHQKWPTMALSPMTRRVGSGRATPKPVNRLAKMGTTHFSRAPTMSTAIVTTATG